MTFNQNIEKLIRKFAMKLFLISLFTSLILITITLIGASFSVKSNLKTAITVSMIMFSLFWIAVLFGGIDYLKMFNEIWVQDKKTVPSYKIVDIFNNFGIGLIPSWLMKKYVLYLLKKEENLKRYLNPSPIAKNFIEEYGNKDPYAIFLILKITEAEEMKKSVKPKEISRFEIELENMIKKDKV